MVELHLEVVNLYFIRTWESEPINLIPTSKYKKCEKSQFLGIVQFLNTPYLCTPIKGIDMKKKLGIIRKIKKKRNYSAIV